MALHVITEEGLDKLTMKRLATRMDYAVGALYRYFDSKDRLLTELQKMLLSELADLFVASDQHCKKQLADTAPEVQTLCSLINLAYTYHFYQSIYPIKFELLSMILSTPKEVLSQELGQEVMLTLAPLTFHIQHLFLKAEDQDILASHPPAAQKTILFWSAIQGLLEMKKLQRFAAEIFDIPILLSELTQSLLLGWGCSQENIQEATSAFHNTWLTSTAFLHLFQLDSTGDTP